MIDGPFQGSDSSSGQIVIRRELACLIYLMITRGEEYVEQGMEIYEQRRLNRSFAHLDRRAKQLGYQLVQIAENDREQKVAKSAA